MPLPQAPATRAPRTIEVACLDIVRGMRAHGALDSARLMAFNFFLSAVPLFVLMGFVLGHFVRVRGVEALVGPLFDAMPAETTDLVRHELERLAGANHASIAPLGAVVFLWLASSGIHQMMDVFETVSRAPRRPWWKQRLLAVCVVISGLAAASATAWAIVAGDDAVHEQDAADATVAPTVAPSSPTAAPAATPTSGRGGSSPTRQGRAVHPPARLKKRPLLTRIHSGWESVVVGIVVLAAGLIALAALYRFAVEHPRSVGRRAWPGALTAMVAWLVVSWLFGVYIESLGSYAVYYGGLAAVAVLMLWLFMTSLALLLGAEVNAMLEGVGAHEWPRTVALRGEGRDTPERGGGRQDSAFRAGKTR